MLDGLSKASQQLGLKMSTDKTEIMLNSHVVPTPLKVGDTTLEFVGEYVYLGQTIQPTWSNFGKEVNRPIRLGWAAFGKLRDFFTSKIPQCLNTKVFHQYVLPVMTYG